jgi:hypothetical protein
MYCLLLFHVNNGYANMPECYVICTLPVLLLLKIITGPVILMVTGFRAEVVPLVFLDALITCYLAWQHSATFSANMLNVSYDLDSMFFNLFFFSVSFS